MTKEEFRQLFKTAWEKQHGFVIIDLSSKNTTVNIEVDLTGFTYETKIKTKQICCSRYKMENLLIQIVNNTEPKRSFSIVVQTHRGLTLLFLRVVITLKIIMNSFIDK